MVTTAPQLEMNAAFPSLQILPTGLRRSLRSAFAYRLDNQIRKAKNHDAELLPDEEAVDRHMRLLFWQSLKEIQIVAAPFPRSCRGRIKLSGVLQPNLLRSPPS